MAKPQPRPFPATLIDMWDEVPPVKPKPVDLDAAQAKVDRERGAVSKLGGKAVGGVAKPGRH
jgi:hypothetical protein